MQLAALTAGGILGHTTKIDGQRALVIEGSSGQSFGVVRPKPNEQRSRRRDPKTLGSILEADDGSWFVPSQHALREKHRSVQDANGSEVASIYVSLSSYVLHVPGGDVTWQRHRAGRPRYSIDGLFAVSRTAMHTFVAGISRTPFKGEITEALTRRADASLVLLLGSWAAMNSIDTKVATRSDT